MPIGRVGGTVIEHEPMTNAFLSYAIGIYGLLAFATVDAQPTIHLTDAPAPGFTAPFNEVFGLPAMSSGPDRVWNFSAAAVTNTRQLQTSQPSSAPGSLNFPGATVVTFADNVQPYSFLRVAGGQLLTLGVMTMAPQVYSNPLVTMVFPCTYNTSWTDSYAFPGEQGTRSYVADGYGTLIAPVGEITDVLKVRSEYTGLDTMIQGTSYIGLTVQDVFWRSGTPWPVATSFWNRLFVGGQLVEEVRGGSVIAELPASVGSVLGGNGGVRVWPNPSTGLVSIMLDHSGPWSVTCIDAIGREVLAVGPQFLSGQGLDVDLGALASGRYVLRLEGEHGAIRHAVVQRE